MKTKNNINQALDLINAKIAERGLNFKPFPKQLEFLELTKKAPLTSFIAGNGCGKTEFAMQIVKALATGIYPPWWQYNDGELKGQDIGRRFNEHTTGLIIKKTTEGLNSIILDNLIGDEEGRRPPNPNDNKSITGDMAVIPRHLVHIPKNKKAVRDKNTNSVSIIWRDKVNHSKIYLRSEEQNFTKILGKNLHWIWIDEEVDYEYFIKLAIRLRGSDKTFLFITATPENGENDFYNAFVYRLVQQEDELIKIRIKEGEVNDYRAYIHASWKDNPTLSEEKKDMMRKLLMHNPEKIAIAEHGKPISSSSLVFNIPRAKWIKPSSEIKINKYWKFLNGFDVGINDATAIVYGAIDKDRDIIYIYDVYKKNGLRPSEHTNTIKNRHDLQISRFINPLSILHEIDRSANNRWAGETPHDIDTIAKQYRRFGFNIKLARRLMKDFKHATISEIYERAYSGRFFIADHCTALIDELAILKYDEKGRIVKGDDHAIDAMLYFVSNIQDARSLPEYTITPEYGTTIF